MVSSCCDPFKKVNHAKKIYMKHNKLRNVSKDLASTARSLNIRLQPNTMKICASCRKKIQKMAKNQDKQARHQPDCNENEPQAMDVDYNEDVAPLVATSSSEIILDKPEFIDKLNKLLPLIGAKKIKSRSLNSKQYCRKMLNNITEKLASTLFEIPVKNDKDVGAVNDDQEIIKQLKSKFAETVIKEEKIKILSILPRSWSARKMSKQFSTSVRLCLTAKTLVEEYGIMSGPKKRIGTNVLDPTTTSLVQDFYMSDDISRVCAGKRDYVSVDENNQKVLKQRRLVLMNLKEAYALFKQKYAAHKIGFTKFSMLRPPQCILALNHHGTHAVCVCAHHQNVKLIFEPMKKILRLDSYRQLFMTMMCEVPSDNCSMGLCDQCPGMMEMEKYLADILEDSEIEHVSYKQWINRDGKNYLILVEKLI